MDRWIDRFARLDIFSRQIRQDLNRLDQIRADYIDQMRLKQIRLTFKRLDILDRLDQFRLDLDKIILGLNRLDRFDQEPDLI